ncbi:MAG: glycosyltransferase family 2 protein [Lachnospiraceae bacterium]|nr:glycosyltransferase family 2 protein [Lachnospiraceae bacterium]
MEISIIVPVYNSSAKLPACIESVLNQEFKDFQLILVNDGSKDNSGSICDEYAKKDNRILVIHKENGGVSSARNAGLDAALGKYVAFLDSDDYIDSFALKVMYDEAKIKNADFVIGGYFFEKTQGTIKHDCAVVKDLQEGFEYLFKEHFINPLWNKLFLREKLTNRFEKSLSLGEDLLFNYQFMKSVDTIATVSNMGYHYVMNDENSLTTIYRKDAVKIAVMLAEKTNEFCEETFGNNPAKNVVAQRCVDDVVEHIYKLVADKTLKNKKKILKKNLNEKYLLETDFEKVALTKNQRLIVALVQRKWYGILILYVKLVTNLR